MKVSTILKFLRKCKHFSELDDLFSQDLTKSRCCIWCKKNWKCTTKFSFKSNVSYNMTLYLMHEKKKKKSPKETHKFYLSNTITDYNLQSNCSKSHHISKTHKLYDMMITHKKKLSWTLLTVQKIFAQTTYSCSLFFSSNIYILLLPTFTFEFT